MYKEFIRQYILNLSEKDIDSIILYAQKNEIIITKEQAFKILILVKENCQNLINGNYQFTFSKLENIVDIETAKKIKNLYLKNIQKLK